ncbi:MAG: hypothetical protein RRY76_02400, partial [Clostridia bacterium]
QRPMYRLATACLLLFAIVTSFAIYKKMSSYTEVGMFSQSEDFTDVTKERTQISAVFNLPDTTSENECGVLLEQFKATTYATSDDFRAIAVKAKIISQTVYTANNDNYDVNGFCLAVLQLDDVFYQNNCDREYKKGDRITVAIYQDNQQTLKLSANADQAYRFYLYSKPDGTSVTEIGKNIGFHNTWELDTLKSN